VSEGNGSTHKPWAAVDETRLQRLEAEQILLRRDLTALIATDRAILERLSDLSGSISGEFVLISRSIGELGEMGKKMATRMTLLEALASKTAKIIDKVAAVILPPRKRLRSNG
jgi:hypothetical protein